MEVTSSSQAASSPPATHHHGAPSSTSSSHTADESAGGDDSSDGLLASGDLNHYGAMASSSLASHSHHHLSLDLAGPSNSPNFVSTSSTGADGDNLNNAVDVGGTGMELVRYGPAYPPFYSSDNMGYSKDVRDSKAVHGSCGLYNLGNTCFMNAGLQSLMSCAPLVKFFCESYALTENTRHTLTAHFHVLLCKMWSGQFSVVHPRKFKDFLGFYHSQFEDYRQHDCQEFLALLLDTLHEQLNKAIAGRFQPQLCGATSSSSDKPSSPSLDCCAEAATSSSMTLTSEDERAGKCNTAPVSLNNKDLSQETRPEVERKQLRDEQEEAEGNFRPSSPKAVSVVAESHVKVGEASNQSPVYPISEGSPTSEVSMLESVRTSPFSQTDTASSSKSPERSSASMGIEGGTGMVDEEEIISSSFPPLQRYTSRSNIDDVTSSDSGMPLSKPSLKRVSSGSSMSTGCGQLLLHSEDSNHSSLSAHSTDSEQSSAFKRLKIDAVELGRNSSSNNSSNLKDCVTSSSDCRKVLNAGKDRTPALHDDSISGCNSGVGKMNLLQEADGSSAACVHTSLLHDLTVIDNMVSSCQESLGEIPPRCSAGSTNQSEAEPSTESHRQAADPHLSLSQPPLSPAAAGLPCLDDFYRKETKTLNTNVQVSDFLQEITADSEKFAKVDNRNRPPSKEVNILQEAFGEEDKAEKILIGQSFGSGTGVKDINLHVQSSGSSVTKPCKNVELNVLHNSLGQAGVLSSAEPTKLLPASEVREDGLGSKQEALLKHKDGELDGVTGGSSTFKFDEEEKNVQMQAYSKFNTIPERSNIRADLSNTAADPDSMEVDEMLESSDEDDLELVSPSHTSTVEACSSVPNCLRHCPLSEVSMATRAWEEYQARNDSVVVSTFQGQFRSTVVCSECNHVSVTYEPFMYLSLPIPHAMDQQICVTYISQHKPPVKYLLNLLKTDKISAAKQQLNELLGRPQGEDMVMAEVLDSHISRILDSNVLLKYVNTFNRKIYAFEMITSPPSTFEALTPSSSRHEEQDHKSTGLSGQQWEQQDASPPGSQSRTSVVPGAARDNPEASNQSFDSVVVNSPSSRDTLDCMLSDSEGCDLEFSAFLSSTSTAPPQTPVPSVMSDDASGFRVGATDTTRPRCETGRCQSMSSANPIHSNLWLMDDCVSSRQLSYRYDEDYDREDDDDHQDKVVDRHAKAVNIAVCSSSSSSSTVTNNCAQSKHEEVDVCSSPSPSQFWVDEAEIHSRGKRKMILDHDDEEEEENDNEADARFIQHATTNAEACERSSQDGEEEEIENSKEAGGSLWADKPVHTLGSAQEAANTTTVSSCLPATTPPHTGVSSSTQNPPPSLSGDQVSSSEGSEGKGTTIPCPRRISPSLQKDDLPSVLGNILSSSCRDDVDGDGEAHRLSRSYSGRGDAWEGLGGRNGRASRSCPSPKDLSHTREQEEATLLGAAAKLGENPGSYFLHHAGEDEDEQEYEYYSSNHRDECTTSKAAASVAACEDVPKKTERDCEGPDWSNTFPVHSFTASDVQQSSYASLSDQWKSCAICLEDLLDTELLTHVMCDGVFCQNCLEMSVKHTVDVSAFSCPICLQPANMCEDFVPLASASGPRPKIRTVQMCIAFRQSLQDNTGANLLQLFGHPNIVHMPSVITGQALYSLVDQLVSPLLPLYSILLTDGQGLTCSRCPYSAHCTGCQVSREACEMSLQPSDCLTVHVRSELTPDQLTDLQLVHDDTSMAGLRSSEPTTIMDCFGAFTQSELLDEHNPWYCPSCERNQCAKKTMTVWRYPDNLIIHLKRFVYQDLSSTKVDAKVVFPHEGMDVRGFLSGPSSSGLLYDLHSIVCHLGGASAGHYTCFARHPLTYQWYFYNDETVSAQEPGDTEFTNGYVLFYQRKGTEVNFTIPENIPSVIDEDVGTSAVISGAAIPLGPPPASSFTSTPSSSSSYSSSSSSASRSNCTSSNVITTTTCVFRMESPITVELVFPVDQASEPAGKPALPSSTVPAVPDHSNDDEDDYDNERRCSPCDNGDDDDDTALTVHFGSSFPNPDQITTAGENDDEEEADDLGEENEVEEASEADTKVSPPPAAADRDKGVAGDEDEDSYSNSFTEPDSTLILY